MCGCAQTMAYDKILQVGVAGKCKICFAIVSRWIHNWFYRYKRSLLESFYLFIFFFFLLKWWDWMRCDRLFSITICRMISYSLSLTLFLSLLQRLVRLLKSICIFCQIAWRGWMSRVSYRARWFQRSLNVLRWETFITMDLNTRGCYNWNSIVLECKLFQKIQFSIAIFTLIVWKVFRIIFWWFEKKFHVLKIKGKNNYYVQCKSKRAQRDHQRGCRSEYIKKIEKLE